MCKMASFVLTKDTVYWSKKTDSHEEIIEEHGLKERGLAGKVGILRVEIAPENNDYLLPVDRWIFGYDQDMLPDWADKEADERRTRAALREWYSACVVPAGVVRAEVKAGEVVKMVCGGTVNDVRGGTVNEVCGGTVNDVRGGTVNEVCGGTVNAVWCGTVNEVRGGTVNEVCGGTVNEVCGKGSVIYYRGVKKPVVSGQGVLIDRSGEKVKVILAEDTK